MIAKQETNPELSTKQVQLFFEYLQGEYIPPGFNNTDDPKLSQEQAWNVIYMLQEWLHVVPDHFELCNDCEQIFDIDDNDFYAGDTKEQIDDNIEAGFNVDYNDVGKFFCSGCR